jgi:hypothetical protein
MKASSLAVILVSIVLLPVIIVNHPGPVSDSNGLRSPQFNADMTILLQHGLCTPGRVFPASRLLAGLLIGKSCC